MVRLSNLCEGGESSKLDMTFATVKSSRDTIIYLLILTPNASVASGKALSKPERQLVMEFSNDRVW